MIVSSKIPTKLFLDFCPEIFCTFLGASWKLFGLPVELVYNIINKEAIRKPQKAARKPPGRYKKIQGRNPEIISLVFWKKLSFHKDIIKLTDLQHYRPTTYYLLTQSRNECMQVKQTKIAKVANAQFGSHLKKDLLFMCIMQLSIPSIQLTRNCLNAQIFP